MTNLFVHRKPKFHQVLSIYMDRTLVFRGGEFIVTNLFVHRKPKFLQVFIYIHGNIMFEV